MTKKVEIAVGLFLAAVFGMVLLSVAGCSGREVEDAKKEATEAKKREAKLQVQLATVIDDHEALQAELNVVRQTRDELQKQVDALTQERDSALGVAEQAEQVITNLSDRAAGQTTTQAALQKEIEELKVLVAEQQALIEELQIAPPEPEPILDPNDIPPGLEG